MKQSPLLALCMMLCGLTVPVESKLRRQKPVSKRKERGLQDNTSLESFFSICFLTSGSGNVDLNLAAQTLAVTYNNLATTTFSDPLERRMVTVEVLEVEARRKLSDDETRNLQVSRYQNLNVFLRVTGSCRGCASRTRFTNQIRRRRRHLKSSSKSTKGKGEASTKGKGGGKGDIITGRYDGSVNTDPIYDAYPGITQEVPIQQAPGYVYGQPVYTTIPSPVGSSTLMPTASTMGIFTPVPIPPLEAIVTPMPVSPVGDTTTPPPLVGTVTPMPVPPLAATVTPMPVATLASTVSPMPVLPLAGTVTPMPVPPLAGTVTSMPVPPIAGTATPTPVPPLAGTISPMPVPPLAGTITPMPITPPVASVVPMPTPPPVASTTPMPTTMARGDYFSLSSGQYSTDPQILFQFPSSAPSAVPSGQPSAAPSSVPSGQPSSAPSFLPSTQPSLTPSSMPSMLPSSTPSTSPSTLSMQPIYRADAQVLPTIDGQAVSEGGASIVFEPIQTINPGVAAVPTEEEFRVAYAQEIRRLECNILDVTHLEEVSP